MLCPRPNLFHIGGNPEHLEGEPMVIPFPSYLIRHPKGDVVVDGGWRQEVCAAGDPSLKPTTIGTLVLGPDSHVLAQVEALDVDPADVRYVVHTHLHNDHVGGTGHFPNAIELVDESELRVGLSPGWFTEFIYDTEPISAPDLNWETIAIAADDPGHDLYGDGTIRLIATPGHSIGHMSLVLSGGDGASLILAGDAVPDRPHFEEEAMPGWSVDAEKAAASIKRVRELQDQLQCEVLFGHSIEQWQDLAKGPDSLL